MNYKKITVSLLSVSLLVVMTWAATQLTLRAAGTVSVTISAPAHGAVFEENQPIPLSAAISGAATVQQLEIKADGVVLQSGATAQLDHTWNGAASGVHNITAVATVNGGSVISSTAAIVLVRPPAHVDAPYPASPVILGVQWDSAANVARDGLGSDNWWPTWGDDDFLYSGYGDGSGFKPHTEEPLSMGFAKIEGSPSHFVGTNIRSVHEKPLDELGAGGRKVEKNGGMLMVDGRLYMWVRNLDLDGRFCKLAWSDDRAVTWSYADWDFQEFGFCVFVNFGKNYADARDNYVYITSVDAPSGYQFVNDFIMMRVPKDQLANRSAYEFFDTLDAQGDPIWSADVADRGPIFTIADKARRGSIYYHKPLDRYLFWQGYTGGLEQRTEGSFGIYDAPEPWGPWTTVYYTNSWDMGVGDAGGFPAKWNNVDGRTLYLVFSGLDAFSVRKATLTLFEPLIPTPAPTVAPTPTPTLVPSAQNLVLTIQQSSDDVKEFMESGNVDLDSALLDISANAGSTQIIGLRYQGVSIPQGATVLRAYLDFTNRQPQDQWTDLEVHGEAIDHSDPFTATVNNVTSRPLTNAVLEWPLVEPWPIKDAVYRSPNLAHVIQEIVSRPGWQSGNALSLMVSGFGYRWARAYDASPDRAPRLIIDYTTEILPSATPTATGEPATATSTPTSVAPTSTPLATPTATSTSASPATPTAVETATVPATGQPTATPQPSVSPTVVSEVPSATVTAAPTSTPVGGAEEREMFLPLIKKP